MDEILTPNRTVIPGRKPRLVIVHTMESPEKPGTARSVARWFAGPNRPTASAHVCVDASEAIRCVRDEDAAWAAPGANKDGLHVELAGRAGQTDAEWNDAESIGILRRGAEVVAEWCMRHSLPMLRLSPEDVANGASGICGHVDVTKAFPEAHGTHWDPGPRFPWDLFIGMVEGARGVLEHRAAMAAVEEDRLP